MFVLLLQYYCCAVCYANDLSDLDSFFTMATVSCFASTVSGHVRASAGREPTLCGLIFADLWTCQSWRCKIANTVYMSEVAW